MLKLSEVSEKLKLPIDQAIIRKVDIGGGDRADYIPAEHVALALNDAFGPMGWDTTLDQVDVLEAEQRPTRDGRGKLWWVLSRAVTTLRVNADMGEGKVLTTARQDVGFHCSSAGDKLRAIENSGKGAATDSLKRAARWFGPKLGLSLYFDESERERVEAEISGQPETVVDQQPQQGPPELQGLEILTQWVRPQLLSRVAILPEDATLDKNDMVELHQSLAGAFNPELAVAFWFAVGRAPKTPVTRQHVFQLGALIHDAFTSPSPDAYFAEIRKSYEDWLRSAFLETRQAAQVAQQKSAGTSVVERTVAARKILGQGNEPLVQRVGSLGDDEIATRDDVNTLTTLMSRRTGTAADAALDAWKSVCGGESFFNPGPNGKQTREFVSRIPLETRGPVTTNAA